MSNDMHTILLIKSGGMIVRSCLLSLRSLPKSVRFKVPAVVSMANTKVNLVNCEFMGNDYNFTAGCVFINSDVVMSSCKFLNYKSGAIFSVATSTNNVSI